MRRAHKIIHLAQDHSGAFHHLGPLSCQKSPSRRALKQGDTQFSLKLLDLGAEGGLGDEFLICSSPKRAGIGNCHEISQLLEGRP